VIRKRAKSPRIRARRVSRNPGGSTPVMTDLTASAVSFLFLTITA
jgi:hypothetical protein